MANSTRNDSHLSEGKPADLGAPLRQHHRLATGQNVNGQTNPHGADHGDTRKMVGNAPKTY